MEQPWGRWNSGHMHRRSALCASIKGRARGIEAETVQMGWRWHSPSLRAADVELLARDAGAVDCGLENLLVCLFLGITARGRAAPVLVVSPRYNRRDTGQQAWTSSLAGSRDKSGERERPRAGSGNAANVTTGTRGQRGREEQVVLARCFESSRRDEEVERQQDPRRVLAGQV